MAKTSVENIGTGGDSDAHSPQLLTSEGIRRAYETIYFEKVHNNKEWRKWHANHTAMLQDIQDASVEKLASREFQERLWEKNPAASSGACSVSTQEVIESRELTTWLAGKAKDALPERSPARIEMLEAVFTELCNRVGQLTDRMPWVKVRRVMAVLFPEDFCTVITSRMLRRVAEAMFGKLSKEDRDSSVRLNARILDRLTEVLGPTDGSLDQIALRGKFAWSLWESLSGQVEGSSETPLVFPSNDRRLKGIGAIPDPWNTIFDVVEFVSQNRPTRDATLDFIQNRYPNIKRVSAQMYLSRVWNALGMLRLDGEILELTKEGTRLLETEDPDALIRPFVTKIIGPDLILWKLRHEDNVPRTELVKALQEHYRRWTTSFAPNTLLSYGKAFDLWFVADDGCYALTDRGQKWAARITKKPTEIETDKPPDPPILVDPTLDDILSVFHASPLVFPDEVVIRLHAALHASESKHFVLLSGLSGTGKTQMALTYAKAYHPAESDESSPYSLLVSVQPDWTDPTGLVGYINPLSGEPSYVRTKCLRFLLSAHENSKIPHFLCLDEMNLARVEYYFAPFLSAMETGGHLVFHQEDDNIDEVPPFIPWPSNLFILGTVNMDETTHAFSDKVLDRAFTIEFWNVDLDEYARKFAADGANQDYDRGLLDAVMATLKEASEILAQTHQHFGYRTATEVLGFMKAADSRLPRKAALDQAIFMKVLPKLRGQDTDAMRETLSSLQKWTESEGFTASTTKLKAMMDELRSMGTTRFWR